LVPTKATIAVTKTDKAGISFFASHGENLWEGEMKETRGLSFWRRLEG